MTGQEGILQAVDTRVEEEDFYRQAHQMIFASVMRLFGNSPVTPATVAEDLNRRGELARCGGGPYLHTCIQAVPSVMMTGAHAQIVRDNAIFRRMTEVGPRIEQYGYSADGTPEELVARAAADFESIMRQLNSGTMAPVGQDLWDALEGQGPKGLSTGFRDLDRLTGGLHGGQFVVIAGLPAMGKSDLALDLARSFAFKQGKRTVFFSLEMSRRELAQRVIAAQARVNLHSLQEGTLGKDHLQRVADHVGEIWEAPLEVDDTPSLSVAQMRAALLKLKYAGTPAEAMICDYVQLVDPARRGGRDRGREQEVSEISRSFKLISKEFGIPVIVCAQLNRGPEQRADHWPVLADLRESGSLEQDADIVILVHREDYYERESPRAGEADLIVAKHRMGPTAVITVAFQGHHARFVDMARI